MVVTKSGGAGTTSPSNNTTALKRKREGDGTLNGTVRRSKRTKPCVTAPPAFSFGVEMEIVVHCNPREYLNQLPREYRRRRDNAEAARELSSDRDQGGYEYLIRQSMANTLSSNGFAVNEIDGAEMTGRWTVGTDKSIQTHREFTAAHGETAVIGVELKTPALAYSPDSLTELVGAVRLLNDRYSISSNQSCQLHVHVGLLKAGSHHGVEQAPYTLPTLQNLAALAITFEHQFAQLHPADLLRDRFCRPLRVSFAREGELADALQLLLEARSVPTLLDLLGPNGIDDRKYAVNFQNLHPGARFGTVEFRRHVGCFDAGAVVKRVRLCVGVVRWACGKPDERRLAGLRRAMGADVRRMSLVRLLGWLRVEPDVVRWYARRLYAHT